MDMISFGTVFLELVFGPLERLPGPGEEVFTNEFAISCGGAVTSASAASAAGASAGLATVLGDDVGSQLVTEHCAMTHIDLTPSLRVERPAAGISVVLNFDGDRGFVTHVPPAAAGEQAEIDRWRSVLRRDRPRWCYLHAGRGVQPLLSEARELGCKIMLDTSLGADGEREAVIECAGLADVFVPNADELLVLTGAASLVEAVTVAVGWDTDLVVTCGAAGALVATTDGMVTEVPEGVGQVEVKDRTGAGDSFAGAMIAALIGGASLTEAAVAGNRAGSAAVARLGAVGEVGASLAGLGRPLAAEVAALTSAARRRSDQGEQER